MSWRRSRDIGRGGGTVPSWRFNRLRSILVVLILMWLSLVMVPCVLADRIYAPEVLWNRGIAEKTEPLEIADAHLGIPYRDDGALDSEGRFTTFADASRLFDAPGLNCSGLVLSVCRFLYDRNWTLEQATQDPQRNSGAGALLGKDWDFGWDLILNISAGTERRVLMPDGRPHTVEECDGDKSRGFDLHDRGAWGQVLAQMRAGRVYLGSISKLSRRPGYRVLHYHVVLMLPDGRGNVWLYHATRRSNVHRMNMSSLKGMGRFMSQFTGDRDDGKRVIVLESALPEITLASQGTSQSGNPPAQGGSLIGAGRQEQVAESHGTPSSTNPAQGTGSGAPRTSTSPEEPNNPSQTVEGTPTPVPASPRMPERVINHLAGRVFKTVPGVGTALPRFADANKNGVRFLFRNQTQIPRALEIVLNGPDGEQRFSKKLDAEVSDFVIHYPQDFVELSSKSLQLGQYRADVKLDGVAWLTDIFEVAVPREAAPQIVRVSAPSTVQAGKPFTVKIEAVNSGAESDYGGITLSTPVSSGLRLKSVTPGRVFPPGSTVLSVTSDRIRTKVPMAERWIELWGENASYDMTVKMEAGRPGTYPLYIRCALRGVNVKSSVILMDPKSSDNVDQQGFPVYVHNIKVQ